MQFGNFNAAQVQPNQGSADPVPEGWYQVIIDESGEKPTSNGAGSYLQCRLRIVEGQYAGRTVMHRLNLKHSNPQTVEIAWGQLSALCHAVGVLTPPTSMHMHNIPFKAKIVLRQGGDKVDKVSGQPTGEKYDPSNEVKRVEHMSVNVNAVPNAGGAPVGMGAPQAQAYQPPAAQQYQPPAQQGYQPPAQQQYQPPAQQQQPQQGAPAGQPWQPPTQGAQQPWQPPQGGQPAQQPQGQPWQPPAGQQMDPGQQAQQPWQPPQGQPQQPVQQPQQQQVAPQGSQPWQPQPGAAAAQAGSPPPWVTGQTAA